MQVLNDILREIESLSDRVRAHIATHQAQLANAAAHPDAVTGTHPDALAANGAREAAAVAAQRDDYKAPDAPTGIALPADVQPAVPAAGAHDNESPSQSIRNQIINHDQVED